VAAITSVTFRFQVFFTGAMALLAALGWVYAICFMMLSIASMVSGPPGSAVFSLPRLTVMGVGGAVVVLVASVVHVLLLRRRLRDGHSAERTMGNLGVLGVVVALVLLSKPSG